ncbi:hypothetical protein C8J57DRAFT_1237988 [Mycena rebaudengoi]|nr:hypothetical protein C8J57DRAFT_1237988 [Mycena rebaudengoi]
MLFKNPEHTGLHIMSPLRFGLFVNIAETPVVIPSWYHIEPCLSNKHLCQVTPTFCSDAVYGDASKRWSGRVAAVIGAEMDSKCLLDMRLKDEVDKGDTGRSYNTTKAHPEVGEDMADILHKYEYASIYLTKRLGLKVDCALKSEGRRQRARNLCAELNFKYGTLQIRFSQMMSWLGLGAARVGFWLTFNVKYTLNEQTIIGQTVSRWNPGPKSSA